MEQLRNTHGFLDSISRPTKTTFNTGYGFAARPALLTGVMDDWAATHKWTEEFFQGQMGDYEDYAVRTNDSGDKKLFRVADYFTYMKNCSDPHPYYFKNSRFHLNTAMEEDYKVPSYFYNCLQLMGDRLPLAFQLSWMYIGAKNTYSALHLDIFNTSAWNAVVSGRKKWVFYPPEQGKYLYNGQVNPFRPDLDKYPEFAKARPLVCVQNPGEIVYTPTGWWHAVFNEEAGVSLTENFVNETNYDVVRMTLLYHKRVEEAKIVDHCMHEYIRRENLQLA